MNSDGVIRVLPCTFEAAKHAVLNWHYSETMPAGKLVKYGVWDDRRFWGVVLFGRGATPRIGSPYDLKQTEVCELVRVALDAGHPFQTTQVVAAALSRLKIDNPGLRLVVSYADMNQGHAGTIYQAGNWIYEGKRSKADGNLVLFGKVTHRRTVGSKYGTSDLEWIRANVDPNAHVPRALPKHKYLFPLDRAMRRQVAKLYQPYPRA